MDTAALRGPRGSSPRTAAEVAASRGVEAARRADELEGRLAVLNGSRNAADGAMVRSLSEIVAEELWRGQGFARLGDWISWQCGMGRGRAQGVARLAARAAALPATMAALEGGEISLDAATILARRCPSAYEESALNYARYGTLGQLSYVLARYAFDWDDEADASFAPKPAGARERGLSLHDDGDTTHVRGALDRDEGAVVRRGPDAARDDLIRALRGDAPDGAEPDAAFDTTPLVTDADAWVAMAEHYLATRTKAGPRAAKSIVNWHLQPDIDGAPQVSPHLGLPLPAWQQKLRCCDPTLRAVPEDHQGNPLDFGRSFRLYPDRLRHLLEHRDGGCAVPGCSTRTRLDVHHIVHWTEDGLTDRANLLCLCRAHHRMHHKGELQIEGDADRPHTLRFTLASGRVLEKPPRPVGPVGPLPAAPLPFIKGGERLSPGQIVINEKPGVHRSAPPPGTDPPHAPPV